MKVIKIGAVWCNLCNVMRPRWEEIEKEKSWLETEFLDFDNDRQKVEKFDLDSEKLPVAIFLNKDGQEMRRFEGEVSKEDLISYIDEVKDR